MVDGIFNCIHVCHRLCLDIISPANVVIQVSILASVHIRCEHYSDVIMGAMASHVISLTIVYSTVHSGAVQRKHRSSASLAFVQGIHRWPVNSPHKWPVTRKMFPFDDVIMRIECTGETQLISFRLISPSEIPLIKPYAEDQTWHPFSCEICSSLTLIQCIGKHASPRTHDNIPTWYFLNDNYFGHREGVSPHQTSSSNEFPW